MSRILIGILYLVSVSFLITLFFYYLLRSTGPWGSFWTFFIIILLAVFATEVWIGPVGPFFHDRIYWIPPLAVGVLIALLLAASTPGSKKRNKLKLQDREIAEKERTKIAMGTFFWFLLMVLLVFIVVGFYNNFS